MRSPSTLSLAEVLDDMSAVVARTAAPWIGVLWLAAVPLRLLQVELLSRVIALGGEASRYGHLLSALAALAMGAFVVATLGRAVYARGCLLTLRTGAHPGAETLAIGATPALTHLFLASLAELVFWMLAVTIVAPLLAITMAALAAALSPLAERPGLGSALRQLASGGTRLGTLLGLQIVFAVALVIAFVNVGIAFHAGLWLAGAVPGLELAAWARRLSPESARFLLLVLAGACLLVEPFWIAAHSVYVHRLRSRETGEDLRAWFERLRRSEAA